MQYRRLLLYAVTSLPYPPGYAKEETMTAQVYEDVRALRYLAEVRKTGRNRKLREDAGLSMRDLATVIGVHWTALANWENGSKPRTANLLGYAAALIALDPEAPKELVEAVSRT